MCQDRVGGGKVFTSTFSLSVDRSEMKGTSVSRKVKEAGPVCCWFSVWRLVIENHPKLDCDYHFQDSFASM